MDLRDTPAEAAFREALRAWLAASVPDELRGYGFGVHTDDLEALRAWSGALHDAQAAWNSERENLLHEAEAHQDLFSREQGNSHTCATQAPSDTASTTAKGPA